MAEYLIHLPEVLEANGVPAVPDDAPEHRDCAAWELDEVYPEAEQWRLLLVASGLTVAEARAMAQELDPTARVIGD